MKGIKYPEEVGMDAVGRTLGAYLAGSGHAAIVTHVDGTETVEIDGLPSIPVMGVANCTGRPLPAARETAKRIADWPDKRMATKEAQDG